MTQTTTEQRQKTRAFAIEAARIMSDRHCEDVQLIDVTGLSQVCDFLLIGSGTSDRQMRSVATEIEDIGRDSGHVCYRSNQDAAATWIVVDFVDLVVHVFEPNQRDYYALEELWSDGLLIPWERDS